MRTPYGSKLSRRDFLRALPATAGVVAGTACTGSPDFGFWRRSGNPASVMLMEARDYTVDFQELIGRGLRELGVNVRGRRVLLKPNLVDVQGDAPIITHAAVVRGAIEAMRRAGALDVLVAEGGGNRRDTDYLLEAGGVAAVLADTGTRFVDLNLDDVRRVRLATNHSRLRTLWLPVSVLAADLVVSIPKLKTHHWAGFTAGMKNLFGVVPGAVYGWPKNLLHFAGIHQTVIDVAATIRPELTIVDAVVSMEGDGPIMGTSRWTHLVAMGTAPASVDATCARVMGIDPAKVAYLARSRGALGPIQPELIEQRGELVSRFSFAFELIESHRGMRLISNANN